MLGIKRRPTYVCGLLWICFALGLYTYAFHFSDFSTWKNSNDIIAPTPEAAAAAYTKQNGNDQKGILDSSPRYAGSLLLIGQREDPQRLNTTSGKQEDEQVNPRTSGKQENEQVNPKNKTGNLQNNTGNSTGGTSLITVMESGNNNTTIITENSTEKARKFYHMTEEEYNMAKKMNRDRRLRIQKACRKFELRTKNVFLDVVTGSNGNFLNIGKTFYLPQSPKTSSFQVDWKDEILFCWQYKVGSTAWNSMFAHLLNQTRVIRLGTFYNMREIMVAKSNAEMQKAMKFYRFMIVRDPFERLLSAYRDRIEDTTHRSWQREFFGPKILSMSRPHLKTTDMKPNGTLQIIPTFSEFVHYLINTPMDKYDPHWAAYWKHCVPCMMNYHAIGRSDTQAQDMRFILEDSGLAPKVDPKILEKNAHQGRGNTKDLMLKYYSTIDLRSLEKLYRRYEVDFFLFDYDVHPLLKELYPDKDIKFQSSFR